MLKNLFVGLVLACAMFGCQTVKSGCNECTNCKGKCECKNCCCNDGKGCDNCADCCESCECKK